MTGRPSTLQWLLVEGQKIENLPEGCSLTRTVEGTEKDVLEIYRHVRALETQVAEYQRQLEQIATAAHGGAWDIPLLAVSVRAMAARLKSGHGFPDNLLSHRRTWLQAMDRLIELEPESYAADMDEKGFWQHEKRAMYRDVDKKREPEGPKFSTSFSLWEAIQDGSILAAPVGRRYDGLWFVYHVATSATYFTFSDETENLHASLSLTIEDAIKARQVYNEHL